MRKKKKNDKSIRNNRFIIYLGAVFFTIFLIIIISLSINYYSNNKNTYLPLGWKDNLSYYPRFFLHDNRLNNTMVVVDDDAPESDVKAAEDVLVGLKKIDKKSVLKLTKYSEVRGLFDNNAIFIGTCDLVPRNRFVNLFADCLSLEKGTAIVKVLNYGNATIVHVLGKDLNATRRAGVVLKNYDDYALSSNQVFVKGENMDDIIVVISEWAELRIDN